MGERAQGRVDERVCSSGVRGRREEWVSVCSSEVRGRREGWMRECAAVG